MQNLELKARYLDLQRAQIILKNLNADFIWADRQIDTYFEVTYGRLKLRQSKIMGDELIAYRRPDTADRKTSDYWVCKTSNAEDLKSVLSRSLRLKAVVRKIRQLFLWHRVRIHLDEVEDLGNFIEFEAPVDHQDNLDLARQKVQSLMDAFGIEKYHLLAFGYVDLLQKNNDT